MPPLIKILNVDDHEANRYVRTQILHAAGYHVIEAESGQDALRCFTAENPQVVLLDINLPDINGREVCRRIREHSGPRSVIVLHISASRTTTEDRVIGLEGGADGYLVEPVDPDLLIATVRSMLRLAEVEKQLEASLAQSRALNARYRSLIQTVPHIVFTTTPDGRCDFTSEQFAIFTGCPAQRALGAGWLDFTHPDDRDRTAQAWRAAIESRSAVQIEHRLLSHDGVYRWVTARAVPVLDDNGVPIQWIGTSTDTHDRKLLLEETERRHSEFAALAEHSPDIIARLDRNLRFVYVNSVANTLVGIPPSAFIGKTCRDFQFPPELCDLWEGAAQRALDTVQPVDIDFDFDTFRGHRFFIGRFRPEFGPRATVESVLALATDITDRKRAELAVAENERRLRRLVESNVIGIIVANRNQITSANDLLLDMIGYSRADFEAGGISWRDITPPEYLPLDDDAIQQLETRGACDPFEKEYIRKDGSRVPILIGAAALDPTASEWVCFVLDLTRLKQTEAALQASNRALQRSNDELAHFAYAASHDLREPLRTIANFTQLLTGHETASLSPLAQQSISFIQQAVSRMESLIQDLLTFSLAQNAEISRDKPIPAALAVDSALANLQGAIEQSQAVVSMANLPTLPADLSQLTLVFQNLIGNSIKYRNPQLAPEIQIAATRQGPVWLFSVRDNGAGFDSQYADRIFRLFTRLHGRDIPGSGVGLAIVKKIIERHDGDIWAQSQPNQGATFFFRLPAKLR